MHALRTDDFDYALPPELIARHPPPERGASRLLRLAGDSVSDRWIAELPALLARGDLMVFNDTRVIRARLTGQKASGGRLEALIERVLGDHEALAQIRTSRAPRSGARLRLAGGIDAEVLDREGDLFRLRFIGDTPVSALLERYGEVPLPPYLERAPELDDEDRYQTVYARAPGAVAAPTAGLHFDRALLDALAAAGIEAAHLTLHVGAGTFQPVREQELARHRMHAERYAIPAEAAQAVARARSRGARVIAVGTTAVRALESSAALHGEVRAGEAETALFITPGFRFQVVDRLLTNFHLPRSTLLMLACAFGGTAQVRHAYRHAIARRYRFYSYGDAMLIDRRDAQ